MTNLLLLFFFGNLYVLNKLNGIEFYIFAIKIQNLPNHIYTFAMIKMIVSL